MIRSVNPAHSQVVSAGSISLEEHERIVADLRTRSADLEVLLHSLPDSFARISADGIFLEFRRPPGRDFAVPAEELRGRHFRDTLPEAAGASWQKAIDEANATGATTVFEFFLPTSKGRLFREARFTPYRNGEVLAVIRSITKERELQAQLLVSDRLASLGTLAAGVAHEINNPLMFILANLEWIGETLPEIVRDAASPEVVAVRDALEEAKQGALRVATIARELLLFSRDGETGGEVDVHSAIESALTMANSQLRHKARIVRELHDLPPARGKRGALVQVFLNLLINAAQAIEPGKPEQNEVCVSTHLDSSSRVVIAIRDTGAGIPEEIVGRIFDPFFTTKEVGSGTGLGLSICHGIIASHGGELHVASEVGRGTVFTIVLPRWTVEA